MANDVKTGIRLEAEGAEETAKDVGKVTGSIGDLRKVAGLTIEELEKYLEMTKNTAEESEKLAEAVDNAAGAMREAKVDIPTSGAGAAKEPLDEVATAAANASGEVDGVSTALVTLGEESGRSGPVFAGNVGEASDEAIEHLGNIISTALEVNAAIIAMTNEVVENGDKIAKGSQAIGFSAEAYQEWAYILEKNDSSISRAKNAIETLTKASRNASDKQAAAFEKLGFSIGQVSNMAPETLFAAVVTQLQGISDAGERAAVASDLFGAGYKNLGTLLSDSAEETDALRTEAHQLGAVMSDETVAAAQEAQDSLEKLQTTLDGIKTTLAQGLIEPLTNFRENLSTLAMAVDWEALGSILTSVYTPAVNFLNDFLIPFASLNLTGITGMLGVLHHVLEELGNVMRGEESFGDALDNLWSYGDWDSDTPEKILADQKEIAAQAELTAQAFDSMYAASTGGLDPTVDANLFDAATAAVENFRAALQGSVGDAENATEANAWLEQQLQELLQAYGDEALSREGGGFGDEAKRQEVASQLAQIAEEYQQIAESNAVDDVVQSTTEAAQTLTETGQAVADNAEGMLQTFSEGAGAISDEFVAGVDEMSSAATTAIQNTQSVMEANMAILGANANVWGQDMMISLANGILSGSNSYVVPAIDAVASAIESRIGFSEPDLGPLADFHTFAPDMMQLFAQGIREGQGLLDAAIGDVFDLGPLIAAQNGGGQSFNYGGVNVTIYGAEGQSADELYEVFSYRLQHDVADREAVFSS